MSSQEVRDPSEVAVVDTINNRMLITTIINVLISKLIKDEDDGL